jgi:hypothetical protein
MEMYISLENSRVKGFKKWANTHRPSNDDVEPGGATPIAVRELPSDRDAPADLPHRPWGVPGVGGAF